MYFLYKIKTESEIIEGPFDEVNLDHPNSVYFILKNDLKNKFFESCKKYEDEIEVNEFGHDRYVSIVTINLKHTDKAYAILELLMILNILSLMQKKMGQITLFFPNLLFNMIKPLMLSI